MHTLNRFLKFNSYMFNSPSKALFLKRTRLLFFTAGCLSLAGAGFAAFSLSLRHLAVLVLCSLPGLLYPLPIIPSLRGGGRFRSLKEIPGSKDIFMALGWAFIIVLFPAFGNPDLFSEATVPAFVFLFFIVAARSVLFDILDIPGDRISGNDTIPIVMGISGTRRLLATLLGLSAAMLTAGLATGFSSPLSAVFYIPMVYLAVSALFYTERTAYYPNIYESLIDLSFIITGLAALLLA
jgi:4-hydroxy-3-methylbut-2-enyl diphosphate reductase